MDLFQFFGLLNHYTISPALLALIVGVLVIDRRITVRFAVLDMLLPDHERRLQELEHSQRRN